MSSLFGLDQSNRLVFVSEAARGLACQCRCVVCCEPLIARQGSVREHHFAHASGREPCDASHESLLHRYAKQVIHEAGGLVVPLHDEVVGVLGLDAGLFPATRLALSAVEVEKTLADVRPDILGHTDLGVAVAIEVAYSSFCDMLKVDAFARLRLPALEIDLRTFTPDAFDPDAVRAAVLDAVAGKGWLWPMQSATPAVLEPEHPVPPPEAAGEAPKHLPEEIVAISGRWVSIKEFASGDIAIRVIRYDPDVVSLVKTIAKANYARYSPKWKSWNVPRWRAESARTQLRAISAEVVISLSQRGSR
jgi:competence protein CoiA